jgi:hypothetical protein
MDERSFWSTVLGSGKSRSSMSERDSTADTVDFSAFIRSNLEAGDSASADHIENLQIALELCYFDRAKYWADIEDYHTHVCQTCLLEVLKALWPDSEAPMTPYHNATCPGGSDVLVRPDFIAWHNKAFELQGRLKKKEGVWCCPHSPLPVALLEQSDCIKAEGTHVEAYCLWRRVEPQSGGSGRYSEELLCFHRDLIGFKRQTRLLGQGEQLTEKQRDYIKTYNGSKG